MYFPRILGLDRDKLVELLNTQIGSEMQPDSTQPKQKILKPVGPFKTRIADLKTSIAQAEKSVAELKVQIRESEDILKGLNMGVMKIRRRGNPDDIIVDKNTREQFKYEERKLLDGYQDQKRNLEKQLRDYRHELMQLQIRVSKWGSNPEDYELKYQMTPIKLRDTFLFDADSADRDGFDGNLPEGYEYGIDAYIQLVSVYGPIDSPFKHWKDFENRIVRRAVTRHLIQVPEDTLKQHPGLRDPNENDPVPPPFGELIEYDAGGESGMAEDAHTGKWRPGIGKGAVPFLKTDA